MKLPRFIIAAPASGHGKTTLSMGLMAAFVKRGLKVQPYKVGPDYIDPAFHTNITGRNSINLDGWLLEENCILGMFAGYSNLADLSIIEGAMGLYDGFGDDPLLASTAGISRLLAAPVIIVMHAQGMAASAAAIVHGLKSFADIDIKGVVINKPSSVNHFEILKSAIEKHTEINVLGYMPKTQSIELSSRHLGLVQSCEIEKLSATVERMAEVTEQYIDLDKVLQMADGANEINVKAFEDYSFQNKTNIAIAKDEAFNFYYWENLRILERMGANLKFFSPLRDAKLPQDCGGLYIGGGYPELFADKLQENKAIRKEIYDNYLLGMPILAECGGYMYINSGISLPDGKEYEFVGIFRGKARMTDRLQNFGYCEAEALEDNILISKAQRIKVHEFHKSVIDRNGERYSVKVYKHRNGRQEEWYCGMQRGNAFGMYPHIYFPSNMRMAENFYKKCRDFRDNSLGIINKIH